MRIFMARFLGLSIMMALVLCAAFRASGFADEQEKAKGKEKEKDQAQSPVEVYEWSIWVGNPAQPTINTARLYRNAMPNIIGTSRPKLDDKEKQKESTGKFPIAPVSVVQFFGEGRRDVDVDLRAKKGSFLSHWPASKEHTGRLQWFGSDLGASPPADIPPSYLPEGHWFQKLRET
jgi:hypothetical protein